MSSPANKLPIFHSVHLLQDKCKGCTNCIETCPTEAIRVTRGKARIIDDRCIDCGECIRRCPSHAKQAVGDSLEDLKEYKYKAVIPAPALYGQFSRRFSVSQILQGLLDIGFDEVYEAATAADLTAAYIDLLLKQKNQPLPMISSSCPACVRLIQVKFPALIPNIIQIESPMEAAARILRAMHPELKREELGIFFITPCPAKITSVRSPLGNDISSVDKVIPIKDLFIPLLNAIEAGGTPSIKSRATGKGISWASRDGEVNSIDTESCLTADNIHQVSSLLEKIENGKMKGIDYIEITACPGGCVGGPLTVEDPHIARMRVQYHVRKEFLSQKSEAIQYSEERLKAIFSWSNRIEPREVLKLSDDFDEAMDKLTRIDEYEKQLPGLDCGACGAPTCRALAEDIVQNRAEITDCIFILRDRIHDLTEEMNRLEQRMPPRSDQKDK